MEEMNGVFIYKGEKRKTVYYDWLSKDPHYINHSDYKKINLFQLSIPLCVLVVYVLNTVLGIDLIISCVCAICLFVVAKLVFNNVFIKNLPVAKGFVRPKSAGMASYLEKLTSTRLVLMTILLIIFAVLTFIVTKQQAYEGAYLYLNYIVIAVACFGAGMSLVTVVKRYSKRG